MKVHVDIDEVLFNDAVDGTVIRDKIGKTQAPRAPVAAHLANDELALGSCLLKRLVNLFQWVDFFVLDFFERRLFLGIRSHCKQCSGENDNG